jgi:hypothetical protein
MFHRNVSRPILLWIAWPCRKRPFLVITLLSFIQLIYV